MARGGKVPVGARLLSSIAGTVDSPGEANHGADALVELYEGFYSDGYKSDFERRQIRYLYIRAGEERYTLRYSGRNLDEAQRQFDDCASVIRPAAPDPLQVWRDTFGTAELVAECAQAELWLGDFDTPPALTLEEVTQQAREEANRA